jgi:hypothetical protein
VTRRLLRVAFAVPLLAIGFGTASAAARVGPATPLCAQAASTYHAGIVVELGDGTVRRQCVGISPGAKALDVLHASGIEYATQTYGSLGAAVCQIDYEPTSYTECLPSSGSYWLFFISRGGGAWTTSSQGVSNVTVNDGDDVGFRYDPLGGADPPPVSPAGTCATSTATPSPTARPTPRPTPQPTPVATTAPGGTPGPAAPSHATSSPASVAGSEAAPIPTQGPTATSGVIAQPSSPSSATPGSHVSTAAAISGPFVPGVVLAACVVGALLALLGVQGIRRRPR